MHHNFIDKYSDLDSPVHRLHASVKMLAALALIVCVVLVPVGETAEFALYGAALFAAMLLSRVPLSYTFTKFLVIVPVVAMTAILVPFFKPGEEIWHTTLFVRLSVTREGLELCVSLILKGALCVLTMIVLSSTTPFSEILATLSRWHCPALFTMLLSFMYRYIFLFIGESERIMTAKKSREFGLRGWRSWKTLGQIVAAIFYRAYDRSERVYLAMCARGFSGAIAARRSQAFSLTDALALSFIITTILLIKVAGAMMYA